MARFDEAVAGWSQQVKDGLLEVIKASTTELVATIKLPIHAGGNMPYRTGYLMNSLDASYTGIPRINPSMDGSGPPMVGLSMKVQALIDGMRPDQKIHFGFVASYASLQNYGYAAHGGHHFLELGLQRWPEIVARNSAKFAGNK